MIGVECETCGADMVKIRDEPGDGVRFSMWGCDVCNATPRENDRSFAFFVLFQRGTHDGLHCSGFFFDAETPDPAVVFKPDGSVNVELLRGE